MYSTDFVCSWRKEAAYALLVRCKGSEGNYYISYVFLITKFLIVWWLY